MSGILFQLDIPIGPEWRNVELLRSAILNCLAAVFQNDELSATVGMIAGELIENAIKYGDWSSGDRSLFKIQVRGDERGVDVGVHNPLKQTADGEAVLAMVKWIAGFASPAEAYRARLRELAETPASGGSGLGLVRVAYEGNCDLEATIHDGNVLSMRARSRA